LKNVTSEGKTRKNEAQKRSLHGVNEHFKLNFDTELASAVVFQQPDSLHGFAMTHSAILAAHHGGIKLIEISSKILASQRFLKHSQPHPKTTNLL
jgi:hypothetical protein